MNANALLDLRAESLRRTAEQNAQPVACRILVRRLTDGFVTMIWGFGPDLSKAVIDATERARKALVPTSECPGYDFKVISGEWVERENMTVTK